VTKRHAENNTGKKGKSATSGAERRIQRGRLAKKRCKRFNLLLFLMYIAHEWLRNNFGINEKGQERLFPLKSVIFWDITPCSPLKVNRLGGTYIRHF
jgi:hypothetical protein